MVYVQARPERRHMSYIRVGSALLVLLLWAMREPLIVGRVPVRFPRVFLSLPFISHNLLPPGTRKPTPNPITYDATPAFPATGIISPVDIACHACLAGPPAPPVPLKRRLFA